MRVLEHRRHSLRAPGDPHLSAEGVRLAHSVAPRLGSFRRVITSTAVRAVETATELGRPAELQLDELRQMPADVGRQVESVVSPASFQKYWKLVQRERAVREFAEGQASLWRRLLSDLPDGSRLLMISHGGIIELGSLAARPQEAPTWGLAVAPLEGVRLSLQGQRWVEGAVLRLPDINGEKTDHPR